MQLTKFLAALPFIAMAVFGLPVEDASSHRLEVRQTDYPYPKAPSSIHNQSPDTERGAVAVRDRWDMKSCLVWYAKVCSLKQRPVTVIKIKNERTMRSFWRVDVVGITNEQAECIINKISTRPQPVGSISRLSSMVFKQFVFLRSCLVEYYMSKEWWWISLWIKTRLTRSFNLRDMADPPPLCSALPIGTIMPHVALTVRDITSGPIWFQRTSTCSLPAVYPSIPTVVMSRTAGKTYPGVIQTQEFLLDLFSYSIHIDRGINLLVIIVTIKLLWGSLVFGASPLLLACQGLPLHQTKSFCLVQILLFFSHISNIKDWNGIMMVSGKGGVGVSKIDIWRNYEGIK